MDSVVLPIHCYLRTVSCQCPTVSGLVGIHCIIIHIFFIIFLPGSWLRVITLHACIVTYQLHVCINEVLCHLQMCIRINNFHTLIKIFPSLENHLFSCMRTAIHHPVSALGYISSDPGELNSRRAKSSQSFKPNPHRTRTSLARGTDGILQVPSEHQKGMSLT